MNWNWKNSYYMEEARIKSLWTLQETSQFEHFTRYYYNYQIKEDEIGGEYSMQKI
jgi:hypothetical protein